MRTEYFITMDTHCRSTDVCIKTGGGKLLRRDHLPTGIPQLRELIETVQRPRRLAFEEGAMAGWLYRNLKPCVDELIVCDPRRNAHVAKDGDKDDPIDAEKLNDLYRGGFLRPVHQLESLERTAVKQIIGMYHDSVTRRVSESNYLLALGRRWGVMLSAAKLLEGGEQWLQERLEQAKVPASIVSIAEALRQRYARAVEQEESLYQQVCRVAQSGQDDEPPHRVARIWTDSRRHLDQPPGHPLAFQEQIGPLEVRRDRTQAGQEWRRRVDHLCRAGLQSPAA